MINNAMMSALKAIVDSNPGENNYLRIIKSSNKILLNWISTQLPNIDDTNEKIYRLLNDKSECPSGNDTRFLNFKKGYGYCGPAQVCECLKIRCSKTSQPFADDDKKRNRTERIKATKKLKYGDENYNNRDLFVQTLNANYGIDNPMHSVDIKNTLTGTLLAKYGVDNVMKNPDIKTKNVKSNINNNVYFHTRAHLTAEVIEKLDDIEWLKLQNETKSPLQIANELGTSCTSIYKIFKSNNISYTRHYNSSIWQMQVEEYILSLLPTEILKNDRKILNGQELDIVIPEFNIAIECNGLLWHSELHGGKGSNYHKNKSKLAENAGYKLLHLFDNDWNDKREIVKSRISSALKLNKKIYARNTDIRLLTVKEEREFFTETHLQGYIPSEYCLGLFVHDKIVAAMSFISPRFDKKYEYELLRYSTQLYVNVTGGPSKLLASFVKLYSPKSMISYSHNTFGHATLYRTLGFCYSHTSVPSYKYTKNYHFLESRLKYQKNKLSTLLPVFDDSLTEWENMQNNGYDRIWDCGNDVWVWHP